MLFATTRGMTFRRRLVPLASNPMLRGYATNTPPTRCPGTPLPHVPLFMGEGHSLSVTIMST